MSFNKWKMALRASIFGSLFLGAALALSLAVSSTAFADEPVRNFSASISPTTSAAGATQAYTVTFTNSAASSADIKSTTLNIPTGWTVNTFL